MARAVIDTQDLRAHNCGAWVSFCDQTGVRSRVLKPEEYTFKRGVYRFRKDVNFEQVFVLFQQEGASVRILP